MRTTLTILAGITVMLLGLALTTAPGTGAIVEGDTVPRAAWRQSIGSTCREYGMS